MEPAKNRSRQSIEPIERARAKASAMLEKLGDIKVYRPEAHGLYHLIRAELDREITAPTPSSITVLTGGELRCGYDEDQYRRQRDGTETP